MVFSLLTRQRGSQTGARGSHSRRRNNLASSGTSRQQVHHLYISRRRRRRRTPRLILVNNVVSRYRVTSESTYQAITRKVRPRNRHYLYINTSINIILGLLKICILFISNSCKSYKKKRPTDRRIIMWVY